MQPNTIKDKTRVVASLDSNQLYVNVHIEIESAQTKFI